MGGCVVLCPSCKALFAVEDDSGKRKRKARPMRPESMPDGGTFELVDLGETDGTYRTAPVPVRGARMTRTWVDYLNLIVLAVGIVIDVYWNIWFRDIFEAPLTVEALVFPAVHALLGLSLTYYGVAGVVNKTFVTVTKEALTIAHRPLPWFGSRSISRDAITSLRCEQNQREKKSRRLIYTYSIRVVRTSGADVLLISEIPEMGQAAYIVSELEQILEL